MSDHIEAIAWLSKKVRQLETEKQELIEALEEVEWGLIFYDTDQYEYRPYCPACRLPKRGGKHKADCKLGNALKLARGE